MSNDEGASLRLRYPRDPHPPTLRLPLATPLPAQPGIRHRVSHINPRRPGTRIRRQCPTG
ncbi:hypothetical protein Isolate57596_03730 [Mycobacteroides abscessus subsp. abscessus]